MEMYTLTHQSKAFFFQNFLSEFATCLLSIHNIKTNGKGNGFHPVELEISF